MIYIKYHAIKNLIDLMLDYNAIKVNLKEEVMAFYKRV